MEYENLSAHQLGAFLRAGDVRAIRLVQRAIRDGGTVTAAAESLGVTRACLYNWLKIPCVADKCKNLLTPWGRGATF